jgi:hypothetical protein
MTNKIFTVFFTLIFLFISKNSFCVSAGRTLFYFLKLPKNAVQASLAGMTTFQKKLYFQNPAVIGFIDKCNIIASYASHFQDTNYNSFNFSTPVGQMGWNFSYFGLDYGKIDRTFEKSNGDYGLDGTFSAGDICIQMNAGQAITKSLSLGVGIKYLNMNIDNDKLSGLAMDVGTLFYSKNTWTIAGGIENLGTLIDGYSLPINAHISYTSQLADSFDLGLELKSFFDGTMWLKGAVEINRDQIFFLRGGYSLPLTNDNNSLGAWYQRNLSFGFGVNVRFISVNYAWLPFGELGNTSMISLQAEF